jgi:uncharacterized cupin superfamily protein
MLDNAIPSLVRFNPDETSDPNAPTTTTQLYLDPTGAFKAGFWSSEPGKSLVRYQKDEVCVLLTGVVRLTDESGHSETYRAGETFLIPNGFKGTWETVEPARKFFAIHIPAKGR